MVQIEKEKTQLPLETQPRRAESATPDGQDPAGRLRHFKFP